jgi:TfoX/Sxy family transcriptional regulator of competence genes
MAWGKSSERMIRLFEELQPDHPQVERRTMFGCPTLFANGNLFLGLFEDRFFIRLDEADHATLVDEFKAKPFAPIAGRKSSKTLVLPDRIAANPAQLRRWRDKALAHALSLPAKKAKKPAVKKAASNAKPGKSPRRSRASSYRLSRE